MQSLSETEWDVVISGTGLQQSLLALALSRSNKKVLHVDQNEYYGGAEAAFSLQEVEEWVIKVNAENVPEPFLNAIITKPAVEDNAVGDHGKLSFSRAYTLSLSPQIIYSRSKLLSQLVSSKVYRQLEFQAVGNWWIYDSSSGTSAINSGVTGDLKRIPNGREDVFVDNSIEIREKRNLMKFLKFVVDFENRTDIWQSWAEEPLPAFLANVFQLSSFLQAAIMALTLSLNPPSVRYSLPRISRHLTSMGVFGPGFAAVIPRWGGSSEIVQVACRAGAVGGGVYMLGTGVKLDSTLDPPAGVTLTNNEVVRTKALVTPRKFYSHALPQSEYAVSKMIAIVSSDLASLFTTSVEGGPTGAVSVIAFPSLSIKTDGQPQAEQVYLMAHSSDTGECPAGQCVLHATSLATGNPKARIEDAISLLLNCCPDDTYEQTEESSESPRFAKVLFSVYYEQKFGPLSNRHEEAVVELAGSSMDLAFDDTTLENVEDAWKAVMELATGDPVSPDFADSYMRFEDREHMAEEEDSDGA